MDVNKLVRMANQIAENLDSGSNKGQTVDSVADHIQRFWTPGMRSQIVDHWRGQPDDLSPLAAQSIAALAERQPAAAAD
jgi:hypothetical protein